MKSQIFSFVLSSLLSTLSFAKDLTLAFPEKSDLKKPVSVQFSIQENNLIAEFVVKTPEAKINYPVSKKLADGQYPYQFDVVEVFVSVSGGLPYYEFELSPYNETLEVKINDPKKPFIEIPKAQEIAIHEVSRSKNQWTARLEIPLEKLNWSGHIEDIVGNAYAIIGKKPTKSYWSLFLPKQVKPNFHKPDFFKPLLQISNSN